MYNSTVHHPYVVCSLPEVTSPSFHPHLSLYSLLSPPPPSPLVTTTLLSVSMSWLFFVWFWFFCLIPSRFSPSPSATLLSGSCQPVLGICESFSILFVYFVHEIPHISEIVSHLSLSDWLIHVKRVRGVEKTVSFSPCRSFTRAEKGTPGSRKAAASGYKGPAPRFQAGDRPCRLL